MSNLKSKKKQQMKNRIIVGGVSVVIFLFVFLIFGFGVVLKNEEEVKSEVEYGEDYTVPKVSAYFENKLTHKAIKKIDVKADSDVDNMKLGEYKVSYKARHILWSKKKTYKVKVVDTKKPVIELKTIEGAYTLPDHPYEEEGFVATDNHDGDLTSKVVSKEENGSVYYTVTDSSGNKAEAVRKIIYEDKEAPVITLNGEEYIMLNVGDAFKDEGFKATDNADGDITAKVEVSGAVDTSKPGAYSIEYKVKDNFGNETVMKRHVVVSKPSDSKLEDANTPSNKVIYLTFDDGPGPYTQKLLDVLDKYNVKVTFFVTNQYPGYRYLLAEEAKRGHTVAIHTYSHVYSSIYASEDAFMDDLNKMQNIIVETTGSRATLIRFPGGSSNGISAKYNKGIMTRLTKKVEQNGYKYFDWNVSSEDAGAAKTAKDVYNNVTKGCSGMKKSVVLQHDIKEFSVDAVEDIIKWGIANGYTFLPLKENSYASHHKISN